MQVKCIILLFKKYLFCGLNGSMFPKKIKPLPTPKILLCKINIINILCTCKCDGCILHTSRISHCMMSRHVYPFYRTTKTRTR